MSIISKTDNLLILCSEGDYRKILKLIERDEKHTKHMREKSAKNAGRNPHDSKSTKKKIVLKITNFDELLEEAQVSCGAYKEIEEK